MWFICNSRGTLRGAQHQPVVPHLHEPQLAGRVALVHRERGPPQQPRAQRLQVYIVAVLHVLSTGIVDGF